MSEPVCPRCKGRRVVAPEHHGNADSTAITEPCPDCSPVTDSRADGWSDLAALVREFIDNSGVECFEEPCAVDDGCTVCLTEKCGKCLICRARKALEDADTQAKIGADK